MELRIRTDHVSSPNLGKGHLKTGRFRGIRVTLDHQARPSLGDHVAVDDLENGVDGARFPSILDRVLDTDEHAAVADEHRIAVIGPDPSGAVHNGDSNALVGLDAGDRDALRHRTGGVAGLTPVVRSACDSGTLLARGVARLRCGEFGSYALAVSPDGSTVVGQGASARGNEAAIWDAEHGMRSVQDVLELSYGLDLNGWTLQYATGISDDCRSLVGVGTNPAGDAEAWLAVLPKRAACAGAAG